MSVLSELAKIEAALSTDTAAITAKVSTEADSLSSQMDALAAKDAKIEVRLDAILAAISKLTAAISGPDITGIEIVPGEPTKKP